MSQVLNARRGSCWCCTGKDIFVLYFTSSFNYQVRWLQESFSRIIHVSRALLFLWTKTSGDLPDFGTKHNARALSCLHMTLWQTWWERFEGCNEQRLPGGGGLGVGGGGLEHPERPPKYPATPTEVVSEHLASSTGFKICNALTF